MLGIVFLTMTGMIILDIFSKSRNANKYKQILEEQNKRKILRCVQTIPNDSNNLKI